jgi:hypothetical protein
MGFLDGALTHNLGSGKFIEYFEQRPYGFKRLYLE